MLPGGDAQSEDRFRDEPEKHAMALVADSDGVARTECPRCMCFRTRSRLKFTDTYVSHLPDWRFRVIADGWNPTEWVDLDTPEVWPTDPASWPGQGPVECVDDIAKIGSRPRLCLFPPADR